MHDRHGARQVDRFDPSRASVLDDEARFAYVDPAQVLELLALRPGDVVVDFGTGTGTYAIELAERRPDVTVLALDEQPAMLARVLEKPRAARANLVGILPNDSRLVAGTLNRVLALNVLHELEDEALQSVRGLLTGDGFALFIDWDADVDRPVGPPHGHVYSPAEARLRLEERGFIVEQAQRFAYHHAFIARPHTSAASKR